MRNAASGLVPVLNSTAGLCMTAANWQDVNIGAVSCHLDSLLLKPGLNVLKKITSLRQYLGWSGALILNAGNLLANKEGLMVLTSPWDGSKLKLSYKELADIIQHLKPDLVILPKRMVQEYPQIWAHWDDVILPFLFAEELQHLNLQRPHGVYFNLDKSGTNEQFWTQMNRFSFLPRYVTGDISLELMRRLQEDGARYIEFDEAAQSGMLGKVYSDDGVVDLTDNQIQKCFETIERACTCPTCSQSLTKAYLHHLFQHTPLLCQRFLIQHNVYYAQKYLGAA